MPDTISARIFQASVSMPAASAAGSFCWIASSARPKREFSTAMRRSARRRHQQPERQRRCKARGSVNCMIRSRMLAACIGSDTSWKPSY